ncbi:hypothetical protein TUM19329_23430 [Legionella antarctica]|uniref:Uncharacterized protein n=1 Tax=Legionella antarctica TaxID=2708020 RepID=A0A6F8T7H7_9GAMM|nr:hypothetical protein TUM19329_23430 [Legionella antarctica]
MNMGDKFQNKINEGMDRMQASHTPSLTTKEIPCLSCSPYLWATRILIALNIPMSMTMKVPNNQLTRAPAANTSEPN